MKTILRDDKGMTLAEVLVATGIVTFGLVALIGVMPLSTSQIGEANLKTTATFLAQQRLEQLKNAMWSFTTPPDRLGGAGANGTAPVAEWPDEGYSTIMIPIGGGNCPGTPQTCARYPNFRREVRIIDCVAVACSGIATGTAGLRQVTVNVFFRPLAGTGIAQAAEERVQLTTLVAQRS